MTTKSATRARAPLTHRLLESLKPEKDAYRVPDARCAGLAVRVAPSGVISFDLAYRIAKSKSFRRTSLGKFPDLSLEQARDRAGELTRAARAGRDLIAEREAEKAAKAERITVGQLIDEYIERRVKGRLRTAVEIELRLKRALASELDTPADALRRRDMRRVLDACADAGYRREAEQRRICCNGLFGWALSQDYIEENPMIGLVSFGRSPPRQRVLDADEIREFWRWLDEGRLPTAARDVLRLELCLGARCSEIGGMRAEEIDRSNWLWTLPAERSKNKSERLTPIVGLAREVIDRRMQHQSRGHLFTTASGEWLRSAHVGHALLNHRAPIAKFCTHDLRRTVATQMAAELGISLETIARVIGHSAGGSATRTLVTHYLASHFISEKTAALTAWNARLIEIIDGKVAATNVVPMKRA